MMMTTLLEDPTPIVIFGIVLEAVLATAYVNTRRRVLLLAMLGVLVLVVAGVVLERVVVTDTENVEATMDGVVKALEADDLQLLEHCLAPSAARTRARAAYALGIVEVTSFNISHLKIAINGLTSPPTAQARFQGTVRYRERTGTFGHGIYRAAFTVTFRLEDGRWLVTDHVEATELP